MENGEKSRKRPREDEDDPSLKEVEEFFEILRRVRVAVRYFDKRVKVGDGGLREALETGRVEPTLGDEEPVKDKVLLDLNGEPDPDMADTEGNVGGLRES